MYKNQTMLKVCSFFIVLCLFACTSPGTPTPAVEISPTNTPEEGIEETEAEPTPTVKTLEARTDTPDPATQTEVTFENTLPPNPITRTVETSDGVLLDGTFYPAAQVDAPLVVLFHWAPGDQSVWDTIAPWLQNRGYQPDIPEKPSPWLDNSWFPEMPEGISFNVFTFTFRGCEGGCQQFDREGWQLDVAAVMAHARQLENADPLNLATIGASIGADGAAYGCQAYNTDGGGCQGALSLSPGGYLGVSYQDEVNDLGQETPPIPAWCIYSSGDVESATACEQAEGEHFQAFVYPDGAHGMAMIEPSRDPNPLNLILEFLETINLCKGCVE